MYLEPMVVSGEVGVEWEALDQDLVGESGAVVRSLCIPFRRLSASANEGLSLGLY